MARSKNQKQAQTNAQTLKPTLTCKQLLADFHAQPRDTRVEKLIFTGVGNRDVYNITAPFRYGGEEVLMGRVEERDSEFSQVFFFYTRPEDLEPPRPYPYL